MRNAKLAITCKKTNQYDMLHKPSLWARGRGIQPKTLYATFLKFEPTRQLSRRLASMVLLTRERLPQLPSFPIWLEEDDVETEVQFVSVEAACVLSTEMVSAITEFTLRVFLDVFQKMYNCEPENMPYWLVPASTQNAPESGVDPSTCINWDTVALKDDLDGLDFSQITDPETLCGRFVFDPWDGRCRYFTLSVDESLKPSDPPPSYAPHRRHMNDIMNYCISLSKNSRANFLSKCSWNQPVYRAELVRLRRNMLDKMSDQERKAETKCFVCLEPLRISAVS